MAILFPLILDTVSYTHLIQTAYHNTKLPERQDLYNLFHDLSGSLPEDICGYVHNNSSVSHPSTGCIPDSHLP